MSRLVICGNFASRQKQATTFITLDMPLLPCENASLGLRWSLQIWPESLRDQHLRDLKVKVAV